MKKFALVSMALATFLTTASSGEAASYTFSFTGADLMNYVTGTSSAATPVDAGIYNGARKISEGTYNSATNTTTYNGTYHYSWKDGSFSTSGLTLGDFNFWGLGGNTTIAGWGEKYITQWTTAGTVTYNGTTATNWTSDILNPAAFVEMGDTRETLWFGQDGTNATLFTKDLVFSFTIDLDDSTSWYNSETGKLVFWFGGSLRNSRNDYAGDYQGNMILSGTPVPEPATMLLFGAGVIGLAAAGRRNSKRTH